MRQIDAVYPNGAPELAANIGVALKDSPNTKVKVDMREEVRHRTCRVAVRVLDIASTYRIFIDSNVVDFDAAGAGATDLADVINGWRDAINADGTVGPLVTATSEDADADGLVDTLLIRGDPFPPGVGEADYSVSATVTVGTAELDVLADPTSASIRIYLTEKAPKAAPISVPTAAGFVGKLGPGDWDQPNGAVYSTDFRGFTEEFGTAGFDRLYVELGNITSPIADGATPPHTFTLTPRISVGPAIQETN